MAAHRTITPAILYFGTPVVIISTENEDGTANIAPMSSAWWLGQRCMLGLAGGSQTTDNLLRTGQCVLNLPSDDMASKVNAIARTTGSVVVPAYKISMGYRYVHDKFAEAGLTRQASELVRSPRIQECPVQMEAELVVAKGLMDDIPERKGVVFALEVKIVRVHARDDITYRDHPSRIDPDKWRPMIMSFQRLYGLSGELGPSTLAQIDEENYRSVSVVSKEEREAAMDLQPVE